MAFTYSMTVKGAKQGDLTAGGGKKNKEIPLSGYAFGVEVPHAAGSGQASGRRSYKPLTVYKVLGPVSTQLFQALVSGEVLQSVQVNIYTIGKSGKQTLYFQIELKNAFVTAIEHEPGGCFSGEVNETSEIESVSFAFHSIKFIFPPAATTVEDDLVGKE